MAEAGRERLIMADEPKIKGWPSAAATIVGEICTLVFLIFLVLFAGQCAGCVSILDKCCDCASQKGAEP